MTSHPAHLQKTSLLPWSTWENVHGILKFKLKNNSGITKYQFSEIFSDSSKMMKNSVQFLREILPDFNIGGQNDTSGSERTVKT